MPRIACVSVFSFPRQKICDVRLSHSEQLNKGIVDNFCDLGISFFNLGIHQVLEKSNKVESWRFMMEIDLQIPQA